MVSFLMMSGFWVGGFIFWKGISSLYSGPEHPSYYTKSGTLKKNRCATQELIPLPTASNNDQYQLENWLIKQ